MRQTIALRLIEGGGAGIAGTLAIQNAMKAQKAVAPESIPPMRQDPAEFMIKQAKKLIPQEKKEAIPPAAEKVVAKSLSLGYGMTFGLLYAALRPRPRNVLIEGVALGLITWAAGYLGWLPAAGIVPKQTELTAKQVAGPVATHIAYGVATVAAYDQIARRAA